MEEEFKMRVLIENMWVDRHSGERWCFLYIDGRPFLSCEVDA